MPISMLPISDRAQRRIARKITRKKLPEYVYRWDTRPPATIRIDGFRPNSENYPGLHVALGNVTLFDHVRNSWSDPAMWVPNETGRSVLPKSVTQWVSTGSYGMLNPLDPTFAHQARNSFLYKIRTSDAQLQNGPQEFYDVNDEFDRVGLARPYPTQREWIKLAGIPARAVVSYMPGAMFVDLWARNQLPDDETKLGGWTAL
jgi:hypothetical protein